MLKKQFPLPVKFICGFIYNNENIYCRAKNIIQQKFGAADFESGRIDFAFTHYYDGEMGHPLFRRFIALKRLRNPADFADIKTFCMKVEAKYSCKEKRTVNIDPGYINEAKLVLTTTKDFAHRIYIGKGIYAEVTLCYTQKTFQDLPSTFPDYRTQQYKEIFQNIRNVYKQQIR